MKYTITKGGISAVCDTHGAELISLKKNGKEYIWQGDPTYWKGQNPILFPVLCTLKDNRVSIRGKEYEIQKHGFARNSEFLPVELGDDFVSYRLSDSEQTRKIYPFSFDFTVTHRVTDNGSITEFKVLNKSDEEMYFHIGGHTGINLPVEEFSSHRIVFEQTERATNYKAPTGALITNPEGSTDVLYESDFINLDYSMFANDAIMLTGLKSKVIKLVDENGKGVAMNIDGFKALGIWTPSKIDSPFICLEPWNGLPAFVNESGRFEDKPFAIHLEPHKEYFVSFSLDIID